MTRRCVRSLSVVRRRPLGGNSWDRWLDTHVAIDVSGAEHLDATAARLAAGGVPFHAHTITSPTDDEGNAGSVWSAGPAAMAIEFKGAPLVAVVNAPGQKLPTRRAVVGRR